LNVLPLHHVHGIINVLSCALWAGACCEFLAPFDPHATWRRIAGEDLTLFMAVPTIYTKLIQAWDEYDVPSRQAFSAAARGLRLMVSGSAALPVPTLQRWREITGHVLLERYGMTEIGMGLSNPLRGERRPGCVGVPLPNIEIRRVDENGDLVEGEIPGEIEIRGPTVFQEYWRRPEATNEAFRDGWFRTGDVAVVENGAVRILGRNSVDIIKTGGYKVSALEVEEVLRTHPLIRECAVVGVADEEWGEQVAACVVTNGQTPLSIEALREWARARLAPYKAPQRLLVADDLPRNAMGKVQKPAVAALFRSP
jgi:malonyl-CoA/methylmalonyl-CoA synthetase